jgi:hypothetical protein
MESARIDNKRKASALPEEETADFLLDDLKVRISDLKTPLSKGPNFCRGLMK